MTSTTLAPIIVKTPGGKNAVTLVIAVVGVILATGSLVWQIASHRLAGPRLEVKMVRGQKSLTGIMSMPVNVDSDMVAQFVAQGYTEPLLGAEVPNRGRMAIGIASVVAEAESGVGWSRLEWDINPPKDFRLEPYASAKWWVDATPMENAVKVIAQHNEKWRSRPQAARMVVTPAVGKVLRSKEALVVEP
jgi:hypothetical protein